MSTCHVEFAGSSPVFFEIFIPQFDILCFGVLVWSLIFSLILLYFYMITVVIPFFSEIKKFRLKKNLENNVVKHTVIINKNLLYNLKSKNHLLK